MTKKVTPQQIVKVLKRLISGNHISVGEDGEYRVYFNYSDRSTPLESAVFDKLVSEQFISFIDGHYDTPSYQINSEGAYFLRKTPHLPDSTKNSILWWYVMHSSRLEVLMRRTRDVNNDLENELAKLKKKIRTMVPRKKRRKAKVLV